MEKDESFYNVQDKYIAQNYEYNNTVYKNYDTSNYNYEATNYNYNNQQNTISNHHVHNQIITQHVQKNVIRKTYIRRFDNNTNQFSEWIEKEPGCVSEPVDFKQNLPIKIDTNNISLIMEEKLENTLEGSGDSNLLKDAKSEVYTVDPKIYELSSVSSHINYGSGNQEDNKDLNELANEDQDNFRKTLESNYISENETDRNTRISFGSRHEQENKDLLELINEDQSDTFNTFSRRVPQKNSVVESRYQNKNNL